MSDKIHNDYTNITPTRLTGLLAFSDWISELPTPEIPSGKAGLFDDGRIKWLIQKCGVIQGMNVMELGPFEGGHTYMLHNEGVQSIDAVEAKKDFYLKCLCLKEAFKLVNANFYLGSFIEWLKNNEKRYDLIIASGVLYHMTDPIGLLEMLSSQTSKLFLWTHYAPSEMYADNHPLRPAYVGLDTVEYKGLSVKVHKRTYLDATNNPVFCGGVRDDHSWLERDGILSILSKNGFVRIETEDQPNHPNGPCFSVYAEKVE